MAENKKNKKKEVASYFDLAKPKSLNTDLYVKQHRMQRTQSTEGLLHHTNTVRKPSIYHYDSSLRSGATVSFISFNFSWEGNDYVDTFSHYTSHAARS